MTNVASTPAALRPASDPAAATLEAAIAAFPDTRDTRYFFAGEQAGAMADEIVELVAEGDAGMALVVGEPGCGKTLLRSEIHRRLTEQDCLCVTLENGWLDFDDTLLEILSQLNGRRLAASEYPGRYDRLAALKQALLERVVGPGRHLALLVDEAQQLDEMTLEGIRGLTNISAERRNFVTPVLFGQTELAERIRRRPDVSSRLRLTRRLDPLSEAATAAYVEHRVAVATGVGRVPFTPAAIRALHRATGGVPRIINRQCKTVLKLAVSRGLAVVDADLFGENRENPDSCGSWPDSCLLSG